MTAKRITKRDLFERLFEVVADGDAPDKELLCDFINHELVLLAKKHNIKSGPTKTQLENMSIKEDIVNILVDSPDGGFTATHVANALGLTVQKVTALLKQLTIEGRVGRVQDGKKVTFYEV